MSEIEELKEMLKKEGLTDKQIEAGLKYYVKFASKFDIPTWKATEMIVKMIRNMRRQFEIE